MDVVFIGGYGAGAGGPGSAITVARRTAGGALERIGDVPMDQPSFLALHPHLPVLYAVGECHEGSVAAFAIDPGGGLTPIGRSPTGGALPCHLAVDPAGRMLAVANYGDGVLSVHPLDDEGGLTDTFVALPHAGRGPHPDRQRGPHAHQAVFGADGILYVTDLGTDEIRRYRTNPEVTPHPRGPVRLPPGSGPRHLAARREGWLLVGELDGSVSAFDTEWRETARVSASGYEPNQPSHIAVHDGYAYVGNRGPDTIAVFRADDLTRVAEVPCGGAWPRHFAMAAPYVYVAAQHDDRIAILELTDGIPVPTEPTFPVGGPSCVLC